MKDTIDVTKSALCLVTFSENSDHQDAVYSMFNALYGKYAVETVGSRRVASSCVPRTPHNHYILCPSRPGIGKGSFNLRALLRVVDVIRSTGCKAVYFESVHLWNIGVMALLGSGYTKISTLHDVVPHDGSRSVLACQRLQCRLSDYVVIKSPEFRGDCKRIYGLTDSQIIDFGLWRSFPPYRTLPRTGKFLFFGRLRKYKGLQAMQRIIKACPDIAFRLVGQPDEESASLVAEMEALDNVDVVARYVSDEEMAHEFKQADWILLPYESASQSGVVVDAYKYGKPVIAYSVGAIASQVADETTGFLIAPGNNAAFVEKVRKANHMLDDEYIRFSQNAYHFGYENYSAQSLSEDFAAKFCILSEEQFKS